MIRVYYLDTERVDNTDVVKGIEYIHHATVDIEGTLRKLTQDTTDDEHEGLITAAVSWREATEAEAAQLEALDFPTSAPLLIFNPPSGTGLPKRMEYIEKFLKSLYRKE